MTAARLAIGIFCYPVAKYIGSYLAAVNGADALIFTGGIGENSPKLRRLICKKLSRMGIEIEQQLNKKFVSGGEGNISNNAALPKVYFHSAQRSAVDCPRHRAANHW